MDKYEESEESQIFLIDKFGMAGKIEMEILKKMAPTVCITGACRFLLTGVGRI